MLLSNHNNIIKVFVDRLRIKNEVEVINKFNCRSRPIQRSCSIYCCYTYNILSTLVIKDINNIISSNYCAWESKLVKKVMLFLKYLNHKIKLPCLQVTLSIAKAHFHGLGPTFQHSTWYWNLIIIRSMSQSLSSLTSCLVTFRHSPLCSLQGY